MLADNKITAGRLEEIMGLLKAGAGALQSVLADQWREYFYCDSIPVNVLVKKGQKRITDRSSNTKASDNIISNGSIIAVNEGQCMIIVEQGKVVDVCAEAGEFVYDKSTEPTLFYGGLGKGIVESFKALGKRFTFGGDTAKDQRVYYFNTKEIISNKFGTAQPIPVRVIDMNIGLDMDAAVRCNGEYTYKIIDPILFYTNVCGNVVDEYTREEIDSQLKSEFLDGLQPALYEVSCTGIRYSAFPGQTIKIKEILNTKLATLWRERRGIEVGNIAFNSVTAPKDIEDAIRDKQMTAVNRDPRMAAATLVEQQGKAIELAAQNQGNGGAIMGLMGMNMANQVGGMNPANLFAMGAQQPGQYGQPMGQPNMYGMPQPDMSGMGQPNMNDMPQQAQAAPVQQAGSWVCSCGTTNHGKFCENCGSPKPAADGWVCSCGAVNKGKFCSECGSKKPVGEPLYKCDKCGWEPEDPKNPPKFCPECGDPFNDSDIQ